jgi:uncharacterized membrane protein YbhN (UPF0104 family)
MKNSRVQLAVGIVFSLVFLLLALRGVSLHDLWTAIRSFNWLWAVPFVGLTLFSMWLRAWRWRYFLLPTADLSTRRLFGPMMAGFAINGLLPARLGEFARAYVLGRKESLPFPRLFGTIVVERIFDTLVLLGLLAYVFTTIEIDPSVSYPYSTAGTVIASHAWLSLFVAAAICGAVGLWLRRRSGRTDQRVARIISHGILAFAATFLAVALYLVATRSPNDVLSYGSSYEINGATLKQLSSKVAVLSVILLAGAMLLVWPAAANLIQRIIEKFPLLPHGLRRALVTIMNTFAEGMHSLRSPRLIAIVTLQSIAVWMTVAWSMQIMPYGFEGMRAMTMSEATALMVITCLAILIPAAPGYWGLMELGVKFGMVILAVDTDPSRIMAYALIMHALQYFPITGIGLYCLWKSQISMSEIQHERPAGATE